MRPILRSHYEPAHLYRPLSSSNSSRDIAMVLASGLRLTELPRPGMYTCWISPNSRPNKILQSHEKERTVSPSTTPARFPSSAPMPYPKAVEDDGISFSQLRELYLPTMKKDRMYTQDHSQMTYLAQPVYPAVR